MLASHTHAQLDAVVYDAQEGLTAKISSKKTKRGAIKTLTTVALTLRLGGEAFYSTERFSAKHAAGLFTEAVEDAASDSAPGKEWRKKKYAKAIAAVTAKGLKVESNDEQQGLDGEEEVRWLGRHGGMQLPLSDCTLNDIQVLWVHEICAQISPQTYMDDGGHYYKVGGAWGVCVQRTRKIPDPSMI